MFWTRFYELCVRRGTKPNPVASAIGLSSAAMTKYKHGAVPSGEILVKMADYFGVSVDYLLERDAPSATASHWESVLSQMSDEELDEIQDFVEYLLWKRTQADPTTQ